MALLSLHRAADVDGLAEAILPRRATLDQRDAARTALLAANPALADGATLAQGALVVVPVVEGLRADLSPVGATVGGATVDALARLEPLETQAAKTRTEVTDRVSRARAVVTKARRARGEDTSITAAEAADARAVLDTEAAQATALEEQLSEARQVWKQALAQLSALRHGAAS